MTTQYPVPRAALVSCVVAVVVLGACGPFAGSGEDRSPSGGPTAASPAESPHAAGRTASGATSAAPVAVAGVVRAARLWHTVPVPGFAEPARIQVAFAGDPAAARPFARLGPREVALFPDPAGPANEWAALVPLDDLPVGEHAIEVRLRIPGEPLVGAARIRLSQPQFAVWTLDFEGDAASDAAMANTGAIADGLGIPMVVMWNPRAWSGSLSAERQDAMLAWTKARGTKGDEIALHLHMWVDYVASAGVTPRLGPAWAGRGDGYDVPMTAYREVEQGALISHALALMAQHGLPRPTSFRGGGHFADATTLRVLERQGFTADCSAVIPAGAFGRLRLPWTLAAETQPYRPSRQDANQAGDLRVIESPTNAGNTYSFNVTTIQPQIRTDRALLVRPGELASVRRALNIVSHPATIDTTERAAIEALLGSFGELRYDTDAGPLRFVTLAQLSRAYGP